MVGAIKPIYWQNVYPLNLLRKGIPIRVCVSRAAKGEQTGGQAGDGPGR